VGTANLVIIVVKVMKTERNEDDDCSDAGTDYSERHKFKVRELRGLVFVEENE
jgi:hypothetical protein